MLGAPEQAHRRVVLSGIGLFLSLVAVSAYAAPGAGALGLAPSRADSLRITYVGNEGFLIEAGSRKILVDALFRTGAAGYVSHPPDRRRSLEQAMPPFDDIDVVLATHYHPDHFDPQSVGSHLVNNRNTRFISTRQAAEQLETAFPAWRHIKSRVAGCKPPEGVREVFEFDRIRIAAMSLHHGRDRPIENLGFLVEIDDWTLLHIGDTEVTQAELAVHKLPDRNVDVFFVPYWYLAYGEWDHIVESAVGNAKLVAMHMPPPDDPKGYLEELGGFSGAVSTILSKYPEAVIPAEPMETFAFGRQ